MPQTEDHTGDAAAASVPALLVLNAGSSSLKFALYGAQPFVELCRGGLEGAGGTPTLTVRGARGAALAAGGIDPGHASHELRVAWLLAAIGERLPDLRLVAAGHRVVHGGTQFAAPVRVDATVITALGALAELAPEHEPHNLAAIRAVAAAWPELVQVACFDTAFHRTQPRLAQLYALPRALSDSGIVRYGFHGLSYEYIASVLPGHAGARAEGRVVVAHLGSGASLCAMSQRRSVATTMGFTALDGLMMAQRPGALDPGVVLHLLGSRGLSLPEVAQLLHYQSGLLGVSGISGDMRVLEPSADPHAAEALALYAYRCNQSLGAMVAALGGLDVLVFTAGIGERSAGMRARIGAAAAWAGVAIDPAANAAHGPRISTAGSAVAVYVIPTDEERVIAAATRALAPAA